ncbi:MAG TPA: hypothetical protein VEZ26_02895, partial [Sphingomonadaceae bacterium]|nr:hypothetical protein [Sphingomonadaceae bacterium]
PRGFFDDPLPWKAEVSGAVIGAGAEMKPIRSIAMLAVLLPVVFLGPSINAEPSGDESFVADVEQTCDLQPGVLVTTEGRIVWVMSKLADEPDKAKCVGMRVSGNFREGRLVIVEEEAAIPPAIEASKRAERERKFSAGRQDKVVRLLAAAKLRDSVALEREEVIGKPYVVDGDRWKKRPASTVPFSTDSLSNFDSCTAGKPRMGNLRWVTVQWDCPDDAGLPWKNVSTGFLFDELSVVKIQTGAGAPSSVSRPPPASDGASKSSHF